MNQRTHFWVCVCVIIFRQLPSWVKRFIVNPLGRGQILQLRSSSKISQKPILGTLAVIVLAVKYFSVPSFTHAISIRMHFITFLSCLLHTPRKDTKLAHQRGFGVFLDWLRHINPCPTVEAYYPTKRTPVSWWFLAQRGRNSAIGSQDFLYLQLPLVFFLKVSKWARISWINGLAVYIYV